MCLRIDGIYVYWTGYLIFFLGHKESQSEIGWKLILLEQKWYN